MAFDSIDPIGEQRADLRAGIVASAVVNSAMGKGGKPTAPIDFMPFAGDGEKRAAAGGAILLPDPVDHAKLLANTLFAGLTVKRIH